MKFRSSVVYSAVSITALVSSLLGTVPKAEALPPAPPQYVLLAFDGSSSIGMWQATRSFARSAEAKLRQPVKFTYFISGVYYVGKANKRQYISPNGGVGSSAIGWGEDADDLLARYDQTNWVYKEGHEIASHANGHFDGGKWSYDQWRDEFRQFHKFVYSFLDVNGLRPTANFPNGWIFQEKEMVGFRAPLLAVSEGLWDVLRDFNYRYDTSKVSASNYWPQRSAKGTWNFPLASLVIAGTGKKTLSMDYNFYVADSGGQPNPAQKERFKKQMVETYKQYFDRNYNGNRAPIHIGHHFSQWNGGAYWEAMQEFAVAVCGLPEVKCVTYTELANFMDKLSPEQIRAFQAGQFQRGTPIITAKGDQTYDVDMAVEVEAPVVAQAQAPIVNNANSAGASRARVLVTGPDAAEIADDDLVVEVNGKRIPQRKGRINLGALRSQFGGQQDVTLSARYSRGSGKNKQETLSATYKISNLGQANESFSDESLERRALSGDQVEAHADEPRQ